MVLSKYIQLAEINTLEKIEEEIAILSKSLFDLRMKKFTNQKIKSHLFTHTKRRIAQLHFKKKSLLKV